MRKNTNHCLDWLKGIGCICVVFIHVKFPGYFGDIVCRLSQFAVPVFFLTSGYFSYSQDKTWTENTVKRRAKRILWLSVWTTCLYWILTKAYPWIRNGCAWGGDINAFLIGVTRFLLMQDVDFSGGAHLWFLWALLWCYMLIIVVNKFSLWNWFYGFIPFMAVLIVLQYACRMFFGWSWHTTNLLPAITYVITGNLLACHRDMVFKISNIQLLVFIIMGELVSLVNLLHPRYDFSEIGILIASVAMFAYAIKNEEFIIGKLIEDIGYKYSLWIYIFHIFVNIVLVKGIKVIGLNDVMLINGMKPLIVVLITLILAIMLENINIKLRRKYGREV